MGITRQQALDCLASDDLIGIGMEADAVRRSLHPEGVVTYTIDLPLDCTEIPDALVANVQDSIQLGATGLHIRHSSAASPTLEQYEIVFASIRANTRNITLHGLSASEMLTLSTSSNLPLHAVLARLRDAGFDSLSSHAIILDDAIRTSSAPEKCTTAQWLDVHRTAHQLGIPTSATMIFGVGETMQQRVHHLELIRELQQETGGFIDFTPITFERDNPLEEPTAVEYLKTLAVSRLFLDNIPNLQASWQTQGLKVLQMALRFGSNDGGSVLLQERHARPGGATEEEIRRIIRDAGLRPVQRDTLYRTMFLN